MVMSWVYSILWGEDRRVLLRDAFNW